MKKVLLCMVTATATFFTSLLLIFSLAHFDYSDSLIDSKTREIRPPLNSEFLALTERERDGLRGPVKTVSMRASNYEKTGARFEKSKGTSCVVMPDYRYVSYGQSGEKISEVQEPLWYIPHDPVQKVFNDMGLLVEEINYDNFDEQETTVYSRNTYAYDDIGKIVESCAYNAEGKLRWRYVYQYVYDRYGNWIEQIKALDYIEEGFTIGDTAPGFSRIITYYE